MFERCGVHRCSRKVSNLEKFLSWLSILREVQHLCPCKKGAHLKEGIVSERFSS